MIPRHRSHLVFKRRNRPQSRRPLVILCIGITAVTFFVAGFIYIFSPKKLGVEYIDVHASAQIDPSAIRTLTFEQMDQKRGVFFSQKNIFVFSSAELEKTLRDHFDVQSLSIKKHFWHALSIDISARPFRLLWVVGQSVYDVSSQGDVVQMLTPQSPVALATLALQVQGKNAPHPSGTPVIFFEDDTQPQVGAQALSRDTLTIATKLFQLCSDGGLKPLYLTMKKGDPTIEAVTQEGWHLRITQLDDVDRQYNDARVVLAKYFPKDRKGLHYIDVRFDNRIYYQ